MRRPTQTTAPTPDVRAATAADAAAIAAIHLAAWRRAYADVFPPDALAGVLPADRERAWARTLAAAAPRRRVLVAGRPGGAPEGFTAWSPTRDDGGDPATTAELCALYVVPERWGAGVGRALLARGVALARADGYRRATLWVVRDNARARGFYAAAGWAPDGGERVEAVLGARVPEVRYALAGLGGPDEAGTAG